MPRLALILSALLCCAWTQAVPTPTPQPPQYAWAIVNMQGGGPDTMGGGATPTPSPTPVGDQLFQEDCLNISEWSDSSTAGSGWAVAGGVRCEGRVDADWEEAAMVQGPLSTTSEFCSFKVISINADNNKVGCIFRAPGTPGDHYTAYFNQQNSNFALENHDGDHASKHGFVNDVTGTADCDCDDVEDDAYSALVDSDYAGIVLSGTGATTAITFYNFGATPPADLTDPSTFAAAADQTCVCDTSEVIASDLTEIDSAGNCGPESTSTNLESREPDIDDFACGDTP